MKEILSIIIALLAGFVLYVCVLIQINFQAVTTYRREDQKYTYEIEIKMKNGDSYKICLFSNYLTDDYKKLFRLCPKTKDSMWHIKYSSEKESYVINKNEIETILLKRY